jgi:hypothetical protein
MRYVVQKSVVQVIGHIWMPAVTAAMEYQLSSYDVENARDENGLLTRESVSDWLARNAGDFQSVADFRADLADGDRDVVIEWSDEESELTYSDCMYPDLD